MMGLGDPYTQLERCLKVRYMDQEYFHYPLFQSVLQAPREDQEPPGWCLQGTAVCHYVTAHLLRWASLDELHDESWVAKILLYKILFIIHYLYTIFFFVFYYEIFRVYRSFLLYSNSFLSFLFVSHPKNSNLFVPKNRKVQQNVNFVMQCLFSYISPFHFQCISVIPLSFSKYLNIIYNLLITLCIFLGTFSGKAGKYMYCI